MKPITSFAGICLVLPDGRIALQRRTKDAPYGAGMLGIFGGGIEANETAEACVVRELEEETSLKAKDIDIYPMTDLILPAGDDYPVDRHFYIFGGRIENLAFDVYEGDGAEAYMKDELATRTDLISAARHLFQVQPELLSAPPDSN